MDCTLPISSLLLLSLFRLWCLSHCPGALGPVMREGPAIRYLQRGGKCQATSSGIHVVLPRELCSHCILRIGTIACHQRATAHTSVFEFAARCPLQAPGRRVSYTVTQPFPFLRPGHCVDVSLLSPCGCRREALPRRRLAHRARSRAFGNLSTNARYCSRPTCVQFDGKSNSSLR